ncbi:MAG: FapA family protein [Clostridiales bacterium]|nr:FapA family protein [Clostridiales bacterium]
MGIFTNIKNLFSRQKNADDHAEPTRHADSTDSDAYPFLDNLPEIASDPRQESDDEDYPREDREIELSPEYSLSKNIISAEFFGLQFFQAGDIPDAANPRFIWKYIGEFLYSGDGVLSLCIAMTNEESFLYLRGDEIALTYLRGEEMYLSTARIIKAEEKHKFEYQVPAVFQQDQDYRDNLRRIFTSNQQTQFVFIDVIILTEPKKHKRRQYNRVVATWTVLFHLIDPDAQLFALQERWREENTFREVDGHFRIYTVDVSEGGFSSLVKEAIPKGAALSMMMEFDDGQSVARDSITGTVVDCAPNPARQGFFNMRVRFVDISDAARAILVRNILANTPPPVNAEAIASVSDDGFYASIRIIPPKNDGADLSYLSLQGILAQNQVAFGVDERALMSLDDNPKYDRDIIVAYGVRPRSGKDAVLTYHVDVDSHMKPIERNDGTVDFKSLGIIRETKKGDVLCSKTQWTPGTPGTDVMGNTIPPISGIDLDLPAGQNTEISEDGLRLIASMDGHLSIIANKFNILNTYVVRGGVNTETGNIDFLGNVMIFGDVLEGFSVRATGDITINGVVESAQVSAGGSLVIRGGFIGITGELEAGENCTCKFVNGGRITVKGTLKTMYVMNAIVKCDTLETVGAGILRSCHIIAQTSVSANHAGSDKFQNLSNTVIEVGHDPIILAHFQELSDEIEHQERIVADLSSQVEYLAKQRASGKLPATDLVNYTRTQKKLVESQLLQLELSGKMQALEEQQKDSGFGTLRVAKKAYPGLKIIIGAEESILDREYANVTFSRKDNAILAESIRL